LIEQSLGPLYSDRLGDLRRARAHMAGEQPCEVPRADTETRRQRLNRSILAIERALFNDQAQRPVSGGARAVPCLTKGCGFGSAA